MNEEVKAAYELFLDTVNKLPIDAKAKCKLIMSMADAVAVVSRQEDAVLQGAKLHLVTKEYAIRYAHLSDNPMIKFLCSIFLEDM